MLLKDSPGLNRLVDIWILRVHIGTDNGECEIDKKLSKLSISTVKLMVSKCHGIKFELVEHLGNLLATIVAVEQGTLELITGVEPKAIFDIGALLLNHMLDTGIASVASSLRPGAIGS